jgi:AcrR family transcriptional regulator
MPRPDRSEERRLAIKPLLARAFSELGYRRATTAALAERCQVQEKALFRLWPDKRAMFLAALEQVFLESQKVWSRVAEDPGDQSSAAERLLGYEAVHHGEQRLYRIIFAGLSETDDPEIRAALADLFGRFHALIESHLTDHRSQSRQANAIDAELVAWAIVGLGTVANIGRELNLLRKSARSDLFRKVGARMLDGP